MLPGVNADFVSRPKFMSARENKQMDTKIPTVVKVSKHLAS